VKPLQHAASLFARNPLYALSIALTGVIAAFGIAFPDALGRYGAAFADAAFGALGWFFMAVVTFFLLLCIWLAMGRYGRVKLGRPEDEPEFSTLSWMAMLFSAGMGVGLLFWGVAEPVMHYASPPVGEGSTPDAARQAVVLASFHWGLHAWAVYAVGAIVLGYFGFRLGAPYLPGAPIRVAFKDRWVGPVAWLADFIGVVAVTAGVAGSLGMGIMQIQAGMNVMFGLPADSKLVSAGLMLVLVLAYMASASTGLDRGIKWLSNINIVIAICLLLFMLVAGPTSSLLNVFVTAVGDYTSSLVSLTMRLFPYRDLSGWTQSWTLTYFIWWIAWAPFVGVFVARISKGRTLREFVLGVLFAPTLFSILWFSVFGGIAIHEDMHGVGGIADLVHEDVTVALFAMLDLQPISLVLGLTSIVLIFVFLVTSADSATFVLGMLTSHGAQDPPVRRKITWGIILGVMAVALLFTDNINALKAVVVGGAVPFTFILLIQVAALLKVLKNDPDARRRPRKPRGSGSAKGAAAALVLFTTLAVPGCTGDSHPVHVGAKDFVEQHLLAEMTADLLRGEGFDVGEVQICGDTFSCHEALYRGEIDVMVEYTGTGWIYRGGGRADRSFGVDALNEQYRGSGLTWLDPLGFDNGYRLVMRGDVARAGGVATIGDLALLDGGVRMACPGEFLQRPSDGMAAVARRHGFKVAGDPLLLESSVDRVREVIDGRVDVAVVYSTDGVMTDSRLISLDDRLGFFPPYEAAYLLRDGAAADQARLLTTLELLSGTLDEDTMRSLNFATQVEGEGPRSVARTHLRELDLGEPGVDTAFRKPALCVAHHPADDIDPFVTRTLAAVRETFPDRVVTLAEHDDPAGAVSGGTCRIALVGAERFFHMDGALRREERIAAAAVVGSRLVHLVRRADDDGLFQGRIGAQPRGSGGARVGELVLFAEDTEIAAYDTADRLLALVEDGDLDGALLLLPAGDDTLGRAMAGGGLQVRPLDEWVKLERAALLPFLRPARIPAGTYPRQPAAVETVSAQVVLAGPAPRIGLLGAGSGPASTLPAAAQPLAPDKVDAIAAATGAMESPDPVLPTAWDRSGLSVAPADGGHEILYTAINALVLLFLAWLGWLVVRRDAPAS
jgi:glycine betaine transporter